MGYLRSKVGSALRRTGLRRPADHGFTPTQLQQLGSMLGGQALPAADPVASPLAILDVYAGQPASPQVAIDVFAGEWASRFPEHAGVTAGTIPLFEDDRITWGIQTLGGVTAQRVLEIGPLEGGHTYILDRAGAKEVVAVEANTRAFLKCLVAKEILGIPSANFLCGDALGYMEHQRATGAVPFDLCVSSGVLYHLVDPIAGLDLMTSMSDRLLLWTHYYDEETITSRPELAVKFPTSTPAEHAGFRHTLYRQEYQAALAYKGFCGGSAADSAWLSRADILGAIDHFGFDVVDIAFESVSVNGPNFAVAARRR